VSDVWQTESVCTVRANAWPETILSTYSNEASIGLRAALHLIAGTVLALAGDSALLRFVMRQLCQVRVPNSARTWQKVATSLPQPPPAQAAAQDTEKLGKGQDELLADSRGLTPMHVPVAYYS
jgi:hypothetical protein